MRARSLVSILLLTFSCTAREQGDDEELATTKAYAPREEANISVKKEKEKPQAPISEAIQPKYTTSQIMTLWDRVHQMGCFNHIPDKSLEYDFGANENSQKVQYTTTYEEGIMTVFALYEPFVTPNFRRHRILHSPEEEGRAKILGIAFLPACEERGAEQACSENQVSLFDYGLTGKLYGTANPTSMTAIRVQGGSYPLAGLYNGYQALYNTGLEIAMEACYVKQEQPLVVSAIQ